MISRHLMKDVILVHRPIWREDRYGNEVAIFDYDFPTKYRGRMWMTAGREEEKYRDTDVETWSCVLPAEAVIDHHCRVIYERKKFEVLAVQPRGGAHATNHLSVRLSRVEGWD